MATIERFLPAPPEKVFAALVTPETYPLWLVGCQEIRAVDDEWPEPGSCFHHRVGLAGPITVADNTKVLEIDHDKRLVLEVRARPLGRGRVEFQLDRTSEGATLLTMDEVPIGLLAPTRPLIDPLTARRNSRSLRGLGDYLEADRVLRET